MNRSSARTILQMVVSCGGILMLAGGTWADLEFAATSVDKGEIRAGSPLSQQFTFKNQGLDDVEITDVQSSCGCLTSQLSGRRFSHGEQGSITVEINTLSPTPGHHTWQVKLVCRGGKGVRVIPLQISARLIREIVVEPAAINMVVDSAVQCQIRLTDLRSEPLSILKIDSSSTGLTARLDGDERDSSGHSVRIINVQVNETLPEGRNEETIRIYSRDPNYGEIKVPVTIVKRSKQRIFATPSRIELTTGPGLQLPTRMVLIRDRENQPVEVKAVNSDHPAISCVWAKGPSSIVSLKVKLNDEGSGESNRQAFVRVQVVKPIQQTLLIPVMISHESQKKE